MEDIDDRKITCTLKRTFRKKQLNLMENLLTELGAEVITSGTQANVDGYIIMPVLLLFLVVFLVGGFALVIGGRINSQPAAMRSGFILLMLTIIPCSLICVNVAPREESVLYAIRVDDDTELSAIADQFEIVEWDDYPILVIKEK